MREYLLTPRERSILKAYIRDGVKLDGFSVLAIRLKRAYTKLNEDFNLITEALTRLSPE